MTDQTPKRERWIILALVVIACVLLVFVEPGLRESPYNDF